MLEFARIERNCSVIVFFCDVSTNGISVRDDETTVKQHTTDSCFIQRLNIYYTVCREHSYFYVVYF